VTEHRVTPGSSSSSISSISYDAGDADGVDYGGCADGGADGGALMVAR
jgi:hypothetical protein